MLNAETRGSLDALWDRLSAVERVELAAYINEKAEAAALTAAAAPWLHVFYATETGNSQAIALQCDKQAKAQGYRTKTSPLGKIQPHDLRELNGPVLLIASTHGEGDPPEMARKFMASLRAATELPLQDLHYAVLGLGDRSYKHFCKVGEDLDHDLRVHGAKPLLPFKPLDVDFAAHSAAWISTALAAVQHVAPAVPMASRAVPASVSPIQVRTEGYSRLQPIAGTVKEIINLNDRGSLKETYHLELTFAVPLAYAPGDAVGIILPPQADGTLPAPRLYSIASSPVLDAQAVHLTVALASHRTAQGELGYGLCSHYLARRQPGDRLEFYIQRNARFCLPPDPTTDIIMIGPGTGVAPFRAFLQERDALGASGRNWLFFGAQHAHCDFLYQAEWQDWLAKGVLTRMDVAFSRDQPDKIYVQHRLRAQAAELYAWLAAGATLYLCGNKDPMSADVDAALIDILASQGQQTADAAREQLAQWTMDDRYLKDVY